MSQPKEKFIYDADHIVFDRKHRKTIKFNISRYDKAVEAGKARYQNLELAKQRAAAIKEKAVDHLADYLIQFEKNITSNGAEVIWAEDRNDALKAILKILKDEMAQTVVKSKSMISEELELNEAIQNEGIESLETDLGEYIVQLAGEKPYHILTPAMHKSKEDIAELFHQKFDTPEESTPAFLTAYVRKLLREKFVHADVGITGANFLVADTGSVALTENEGNGMMTFSFPKVHIVLAGIEKIIPAMKDLGVLWPLLATHGTGQQITVYNSIISGPRKNNETDGPCKMVVILLDNQRTNLYAHDDQYQSLKCIRCGACLNACPIYKNVGGYTYAATYSGPIGSVITPFYNGLKEYNHLSSACSVCGKCSSVCPVKIPLHKLLLYNRRDAVDEGDGSWMWNQGMKAFEYAFSKRKRLNLVGGKMKNFLGAAGKNALGKDKQLPTFANKSFSQQWKSKQ